MKSVNGFTLIELLVVMMVLAIITSLAVPSYRSHMLRAQRSDATAALLRLRTAQEKFFLQNNRYTTELGPAGLRLSLAAGGTATTENGWYSLTVSLTSPTAYRALATAIGGQTNDVNCTAFTIDNEGGRATSPGALAECWK